MSNGIVLPRHRKLLEAQGFKQPVKPCPFCGSADINTEGPCCTQFMCNGCGASTYEQSTREEAYAAWNTRSPAMTISEAEVERAHKAVMSELFLKCQPDLGDVFDFMDDHPEIIRAALIASRQSTSGEK